MRIYTFNAITLSVTLANLLIVGTADAQLRVANWNVTFYSDGRVTEFQTAIFAQAPSGIQFWPDVLIAQEILGAEGGNNFKNLLNSYTDARGPGPRDYEVAPISGVSQNALFYRTSKVSLISSVRLSTGTGTCATCPPRDNERYLVRLAGYNSAAEPGTGPELYLYAAHMKAGRTAEDQARRTPESIRLRNDTATLPANANFILGGDFNIQKSSQTAFQNLVGGATIGRFFDPINTPGDWNNNCTYKWVFTQDPATNSSGGIDDRLDFLLISAALKDGSGLNYIGNTNSNYNDWCAANNNWNNPNHSYRSWGNDGFVCDADMRTTGNSMVGTAIASALAASQLTTGHLPVYLDLRIPPKVTVPTVVNLGTITAGTAASTTVTIINSTDVRTFAMNPTTAAAAGIETLSYSFTGLPPTLTIADGTGPFTLAPLNQPALPAGPVFGSRTHALSFTAPAATGPYVGSFTLSSNADTPALPILIQAVIIPASAACSLADVTADGSVDGSDFIAFINAFGAEEVLADVNQDGTIDGGDFIAFINAFSAGC